MFEYDEKLRGPFIHSHLLCMGSASKEHACFLEKDYTKPPPPSDLVQIVYDVTADPTLPRTKDARCPQCQHNEAVFISTNTEQGATLTFSCVSCR